MQLERMEEIVPQYVHHKEGYSNNATEQKNFATIVISDILQTLGINIFKIILQYNMFIINLTLNALILCQ